MRTTLSFKVLATTYEDLEKKAEGHIHDLGGAWSILTFDISAFWTTLDGKIKTWEASVYAEKIT